MIELSEKDLLIANLSNILSIESEIVQSKNLSALNAIRKMKADKMQKVLWFIMYYVLCELQSHMCRA